MRCFNAIQKATSTSKSRPKRGDGKAQAEPYDFHKPNLISNEQLRACKLFMTTLPRVCKAAFQDYANRLGRGSLLP